MNYLILAYQTPTIPQVNETLLTIKDIGIALFSLVFASLAMVAVITWIRSDKANATLKVLSSVIDQLQADKTKAANALDKEQRENAEEMMSIGEAYNRLVDLKEQDSETLDKLAGIMAELVRSQRYGSEEHGKHSVMLEGIQAGLTTVLADTPLLPHLKSIKSALDAMQERLTYLPSHEDIEAIGKQLKAIREILELDVNELHEKQAAAERIQATIATMPEAERES